MSWNSQFLIPLLHCCHRRRCSTTLPDWSGGKNFIRCSAHFPPVPSAPKCEMHCFLFLNLEPIIVYYYNRSWGDSSPHTHHCKMIHLKVYLTSILHMKTKRFACVHFEAKQNQTNLKKKQHYHFFFFIAIIALANNGSSALYKEECEHKCDGNILSWIKNFTLNCTSYYDKLFTYSDINFFFFNFFKQQLTLCILFCLITSKQYSQWA